MLALECGQPDYNETESAQNFQDVISIVIKEEAEKTRITSECRWNRRVIGC